MFIRFQREMALAAAMAFCLSYPTYAITVDKTVGSLGAYADDGQLRQVRWISERRAVSCNLRIPCPYGKFYASDRRHSLFGRHRSTQVRRDSYRPCPASVEFPDGRQTCLP
jgi:hypothetical protein